MLDTTTSWLSVPVKGCKGCKSTSNLTPNQYHDWEGQESISRYGPGTASGEIWMTSVAAKNVPWYTTTDMKVIGKHISFGAKV